MKIVWSQPWSQIHRQNGRGRETGVGVAVEVPKGRVNIVNTEERGEHEIVEEAEGDNFRISNDINREEDKVVRV